MSLTSTLLNSAKVVKTCSCGRTFTQKEWERLPLVGTQVTEDDEGRYSLEMRDCVCRSTIGIETKL